MGANTKDGAQLTGLLLARRRRRLTNDLLVKAAPGDSAPDVFGDWLFDAAAGGAAAIDGAGQIAGAEAFGSAALSAQVAASGIAGAEALGSATVAAGIVSGEALGLPVVSVPGAAWEIVASGIASGELFGLATVAPYVEPEFIGGGAVVPLRHLPAHRIGGTGRILSEEAFGRPFVAPGQRSRTRRAREAHELSGRWFS